MTPKAYFTALSLAVVAATPAAALVLEFDGNDPAPDQSLQSAGNTWLVDYDDLRFRTTSTNFSGGYYIYGKIDIDLPATPGVLDYDATWNHGPQTMFLERGTNGNNFDLTGIRMKSTSSIATDWQFHGLDASGTSLFHTVTGTSDFQDILFDSSWVDLTSVNISTQFPLGGNGHSQFQIDRIAVNEAFGGSPTPVPLPAPMLMLGTALLGLASWRKKPT